MAIEVFKSTERGKNQLIKGVLPECQQTMFTKKSSAGLKAER